MFFALNEYNYSVLVCVLYFTMQDYFILVLQFFLHKYLSWCLFIIQGLLNTPSLVFYNGKNRLKTCEQFTFLNPQILMQGAWLTALLPFYRMRRLQFNIIWENIWWVDHFRCFNYPRWQNYPTRNIMEHCIFQTRQKGHLGINSLMRCIRSHFWFPQRFYWNVIWAKCFPIKPKKANKANTYFMG